VPGVKLGSISCPDGGGVITTGQDVFDRLGRQILGKRDVAPVAQRLIIFGPVFDAISRFIFGMLMGSFMEFGHGTHR
jgi:hypothetical protein